LKELLFNAVSKRVSIHREPSRILEYIEKLAGSSIKSSIGYRALQTSLFPLLPEYSIQKVSWMCFQIKNEEYPKVETHPREAYCKKVMSRLMQTLGKIAVLAAERRSNLLVGKTIEHIFKITLSMLNEKFITIKEGFREEVLNVIGDLQKSYLRLDFSSSVPREISDVLTSIAVYALENEHTEITTQCIDALQNISITSIERDSYGYDVARCAARIGIIGAYALHRGKKQLSDKAAESLVNFDEIYLKKSPNPHERLQIDEISKLHERSNTDQLLFEEEEIYSNLFKKVPQKTLKKFSELYDKKRKMHDTKTRLGCMKNTKNQENIAR